MKKENAAKILRWYIYLYIYIYYMRSNQVGNEIENETPPNSAKYITRDLLHLSHQVNTMVDLGKELEQEHQ